MIRLFSLSLIFLTGCSPWNIPPISQGVASFPPAHENLSAARTWSSFDGTRFPYAAWLAKSRSRPKANVIICGGWDSSSFDYSILGKHLAAQGYNVYASELRAGVYDPNAERRGSPRDGHEWVRDLQSFTAFATANQPGVPIYFYGHSFGAVVALAAVKSIANSVRPEGVIIDSPALPLLLTRENYIKAVALMPFQGFRLPHLRMGAGPDKSPTGSERVNYQWLNSPDRLRIGYKIRYFVAAAKLGHDVRINCNEFDCPVLALAGDKDCVVAASDKAKKDYRRYLQEELCSGHAEVIMYPDGYHSMTLPETGDPRLDGTTRKVLTDITKWLDRRVRAESVSAAKIPKAVVGRVTH